MQRITSRAEFLERIRDVRAVEVKARDEYIWDYTHITDDEIDKTLKKIKEDEDTHIALLDKIIELLEKK